MNSSFRLFVRMLYQRKHFKIAYHPEWSKRVIPFCPDPRFFFADPEIFKLSVDLFEKHLEKHLTAKTLFIGFPNGGIPYATVLAERFKVPFSYIYETPKSEMGYGLFPNSDCFDRSTNVFLIDDATGSCKKKISYYHLLKERFENVSVHSFLWGNVAIIEDKIPFFYVVSCFEILEELKKEVGAEERELYVRIQESYEAKDYFRKI